MRKKFTPIQRITALYVVFFVVIAASIIMGFASPAFRESFQTGWSDASRVGAGDTVSIVYDLPVVSESMDFSIPLHVGHGGVGISGRPSMMDVEVTSEPGAKVEGLGVTTLFFLLSALMYLAVFVIIFMILTSLRSSVKQGSIMSREVIPLTRSIGILLICASLLWSFSNYLERRAVAPYFAGSGFDLSASFSIDAIQIITGVLIFFIAEIFSIGYRLSEEQKLTI